MKILAIGDIHGKTIWKDIVNKEIDNVNRIVFIGDYFDSFDISIMDQLNNYLDIVEFYKENTTKTVLLIGNHDLHYFYGESGFSCSGFKPVLKLLFDERVGDTWKDYHRMAYGIGNTLFTHAGLSKTYAEEKEIEVSDSAMTIALQLNELFHNNPLNFSFNAARPRKSLDRWPDSSGDNIWQSPAWIRPPALDYDRIEGITQVVGHTQREKVIKYQFGYMIDSLYNNKGEYLITDLKNDKYEIKKIKR